jgi:hypothetical protein
MKPIPKTHQNHAGIALIGLVLLVLIGTGIWITAQHFSSADANSSAHKSLAIKSTTNFCAGNLLAQNIVVSITDRHLWACDRTQAVFDSAVVTGMENYPADLTPTGTYQIYAKTTDITLSGSDSTGSWNEFVNYWMPFLYNQYGAYGFHDATWRPATAFGNISPYSSNASHGCVETSLSTAKWLYNWVVVGTTVTIES